MASEVCYKPPTRKDRLEKAGYKTIHLFGNLYLVRNHSVKARKISFYGICVLKEDR